MTVEIIAEFGQTMDGDVGLAVDMVHAFADAGATGIKVQLLDPEQIATADARSYWKTGPEVGQREAFTTAGLIPHDGWGRVVDACRERHVWFIGTPFDARALDALYDYGADAIKVASGDITFLPLLDRIQDRRVDQTVLVSTGAATTREIAEAYRRLSRIGHLVFLACTLSYPTPLGEARLGRIGWLSEAFGRTVGYSDHTKETITGLLAVLAGAQWLEKHVTLRPYGPECPDNAMGLDPAEFRQYVLQARKAEKLLAGEGTDLEAPARAGARRAARYAFTIPAGQTLDGEFRIGSPPVRVDPVEYLRPDPDGDGRSIALAAQAIDEGWPLVYAVAAGKLVEAADFGKVG